MPPGLATDISMVPRSIKIGFFSVPKKGMQNLFLLKKLFLNPDLDDNCDM